MWMWYILVAEDDDDDDEKKPQMSEKYNFLKSSHWSCIHRLFAFIRFKKVFFALSVCERKTKERWEGKHRMQITALSCNYYSLSRKNKYLKMHKLMEYSSLNYFKFENLQENFYFFDIKPELRISELKRKKEILQIQTQPHHLILLIDLKIFR